MERMSRRLIAVTGCASALAAVDLAAKALWPPPPELFHHRSAAWILASFVLLTCCLVLALRSSVTMFAAAATSAGGLLGNLVSAMTHGGRIPDPFLLGGTNGIAFNPADVFFVLGISGIVCASLQRVATSTAWLSRWRRGIRNELTTPRDLPASTPADAQRRRADSAG